MKRPHPLLAIFMVVLVDVLGLTLIIPLLPFYAEKYGASATVVGLLLTTYSLCQLVSGPLLGKWSDRLGRRPLLLVSQIGTCLGLILLAESRALWLIFAARIIDGLTAGNYSLAQAYIADVTTPEKRAQSFGLIGVAFGIGFFIGPAMTGVLVKYSYTLPIFIAAGLSFVSVMLTYFLLPEKKPEHGDGRPEKIGLLQWKSYTKYFRPPALRSRLTQQFFFYLAFALFTSGFALFAERRYTLATGQPFGPREVGYALALAGFIGIVQQGMLIRPMVRRLGEPLMIRIGFFLAAAGYGVLAFSKDVPTLVVAIALSSIGGGIVRPTLMSLITQNAGPREYGSIMGLNQSLMATAQIVMPTLAGFLINERMLVVWAVLAAAIYFLAFVTPVPRVEAAPEPDVAT